MSYEETRSFVCCESFCGEARVVVECLREFFCGDEAAREFLL